VKSSTTETGKTLLQGVAKGIAGLTSLVFFLTFTAFATFFLLKDGPTVRRFVDRHLGVPVDVATVITGNVIRSLRRYFLGVTYVAAFNAIVVGLAAVVLGVPLAGTIAVVVFVTAYVPFIGAFVSGAFAVMLTLASEGTTEAIIMLVVVILANGLLQNIVQPIAFGATLDLNPLVVLIVTIGFGSLFGMLGMVLAAPLTSAGLHISRELAAAKALEAAAEADRAPPPEPGPATAL
jgi:predicted PurR-regulated permease PerM